MKNSLRFSVMEKYTPMQFQGEKILAFELSEPLADSVFDISFILKYSFYLIENDVK